MSLAISGFAGGTFMGLSALGTAMGLAFLGDHHDAGWIVALTTWLVSGSHSITGSVMTIWALTFIVGLRDFAHCIATSGEILTAVLSGHLGWGALPHWFFPAVAGNICGGVGMVTTIQYAQVIHGGDAQSRKSAEVSH